MSVNSGIAVDGEIILELPTANKADGSPAVYTIPLDGSQTSLIHYEDISGLDIDMTTGQTLQWNTIPYRITVSLDSTQNYVNILSSDEITFNVSINNAELSYIGGDFGSQPVAIDPGEIDMEIELLDRFDGGFKLANPQLKLFVQNSAGVPSRFYGKFTAFGSNSESVDLNPEAIDIAYPALPTDGTVEETIIYNKDNSNIIDFMLFFNMPRRP